jgi:hypothetical protein
MSHNLKDIKEDIEEIILDDEKITAQECYEQLLQKYDDISEELIIELYNQVTHSEETIEKNANPQFSNSQDQTIPPENESHPVFNPVEEGNMTNAIVEIPPPVLGAISERNELPLPKNRDKFDYKEPEDGNIFNIEAESLDDLYDKLSWNLAVTMTSQQVIKIKGNDFELAGITRTMLSMMNNIDIRANYILDDTTKPPKPDGNFYVTVTMDAYDAVNNKTIPTIMMMEPAWVWAYDEELEKWHYVFDRHCTGKAYTRALSKLLKHLFPMQISLIAQKLWNQIAKKQQNQKIAKIFQPTDFQSE